MRAGNWFAKREERKVRKHKAEEEDDLVNQNPVHIAHKETPKEKQPHTKKNHRNRNSAPQKNETRKTKTELARITGS